MLDFGFGADANAEDVANVEEQKAKDLRRLGGLVKKCKEYEMEKGRHQFNSNLDSVINALEQGNWTAVNREFRKLEEEEHRKQRGQDLDRDRDEEYERRKQRGQDLDRDRDEEYERRKQRGQDLDRDRDEEYERRKQRGQDLDRDRNEEYERRKQRGQDLERDRDQQRRQGHSQQQQHEHEHQGGRAHRQGRQQGQGDRWGFITGYDCVPSSTQGCSGQENDC